MQFVVKVSSRVAEIDAQEVVSPRTHDTAIRFGLVSKALNPEESEFLLTQKALDEQVQSRVLEPQQLKLEILQFIGAINSKWPQQGVGLPHLQDNFYDSKKDLTDWLKDLTEGGLFVSIRGWKEFPRFVDKVLLYKINPDPAKQREIEDLLKSRNDIVSTKVKIFMSYSTHDKDLAGKVKDGLINDRIQVFMAHDDLHVSVFWMSQIIEELIACDVIVLLLTKEFWKSLWTNQECGWAMGSDKTVCPLMTGEAVYEKPYGLMSRIQGVSLDPHNVDPACEKILEKLRSIPELAPRLNITGAAASDTH